MFSLLNKQNSLKNLVCLADVKTKEDKAAFETEKYFVGYTAEEWSVEHPNIDVHKVFCPKSILFPASLIYCDREKGIYCDLFIMNGQDLFVSDTEMESAIAEKERAYQEKNWKALFSVLSEGSGNISMELLSGIIEKEERSSELYQTFVDLYTFGDCGAKVLSDEAIRNLVLSKSEKQKDKTAHAIAEFPDIITVYRGEGDESTPYDRALSWTTSETTAYFFASWRNNGRKGRVVTGTVKKEDVLEYIEDRGESELIIPPGKVSDITVLSCYDFDEDFISVLENPPHGFQYDFAQDIISCVNGTYEYAGEWESHDRHHSIRVGLMAFFLFVVEQDNRWLKLANELKVAAAYHDIGRTDDVRDNEGMTHGEASYAIFVEDEITGVDAAVIEFLLKGHCISDEAARVLWVEMFQNNKDADIIWQALEAFKDADALDRWRFGWHSADFVSVDLLRTEKAKRLMPVACELQKQVRAD